MSNFEESVQGGPSATAHTLRVGSVPYLVGRPLDCGLEQEPGILYERASPARLVEGLREGRLDVALVSSIELFRRKGYTHIADLGVAGDGPVSSVMVYHRCSVERIQSVALDPASRTSAVLAQIVLERALCKTRRWLEGPADLDPRQMEADAWLRIGDLALRESLELGPGCGFEGLNLAAAWNRFTSLPFVFALWLVRPGLNIVPWLPAFRRARARGAERWQELAGAAAIELGLPLPLCLHYLSKECRFDLAPAHAEALARFRSEAIAIGAAPPLL